MEIMNIDILGLSEVRWPGKEKWATNNGIFYYYESYNHYTHHHGVGILLNRNTNGSVVGFTPLLERIVMV